MDSKRRVKKTTTRTLRLSEDLDNILEKDSEDKRVSTNSMIVSISTKYTEWDRYTEKIGFISLPRDALRMMVESMDEEKIKELAEELGSRHPQEYMMFWFKRTGVDVFLEGISLFCRYARFAKYEIETDGRNYLVVLHHEMGRKWSVFLSHNITIGIKKTFSVIPKFDVTDHSMRFFIP